MPPCHELPNNTRGWRYRPLDAWNERPDRETRHESEIHDTCDNNQIRMHTEKNFPEDLELIGAVVPERSTARAASDKSTVSPL